MLHTELVGQFVDEDCEGGGEAGLPVDRERGSDRKTIREVVKAVTNQNHERQRLVDCRRQVSVISYDVMLYALSLTHLRAER